MGEIQVLILMTKQTGMLVTDSYWLETCKYGGSFSPLIMIICNHNGFLQLFILFISIFS